MTRCRCLITLGGTTRCMHTKHAKYRLPVIESQDCSGCPLKVSTDQDGEPILPGKIQQLKNLAKDAKDVAASGFKTVSRRAYNERIAVCQTCPMQRNNRCAVCSCNIASKAAFAAEACPLAFWDHIPVNVQVGEQLGTPAATPADLKDSEVKTPYVDTDEFHRRTKICEGCQFRRGRRCSGCSCDLYTMARLTKSKCPKDEW